MLLLKKNVKSKIMIFKKTSGTQPTYNEIDWVYFFHCLSTPCGLFKAEVGFIRKYLISVFHCENYHSSIRLESFICLLTYNQLKRIQMEALEVVTIVGNGHSDSSSNPGQFFLFLFFLFFFAFHITLML